MTTFPDSPLDIDTIAQNRPVTVPGRSQPESSETTLNVMVHIFPVFVLVSGTGLVERERTMKSTPLNLTSSTQTLPRCRIGRSSKWHYKVGYESPLRIA